MFSENAFPPLYWVNGRDKFKCRGSFNTDFSLTSANSYAGFLPSFFRAPSSILCPLLCIPALPLLFCLLLFLIRIAASSFVILLVAVSHTCCSQFLWYSPIANTILGACLSSVLLVCCCWCSLLFTGVVDTRNLRVLLVFIRFPFFREQLV
jgi:hypothetical protein